ncbi:MAG: NUDIX domain-containing protein [Sandaracinaceae bacterium]
MARRRPPPPPRDRAGTNVDEDAAYLATYDPSTFERPSVTVDVALLSVRDDCLVTLLLRREAPPHRGRHALPGGFLRMDESLEEAAARVLRDKAGLEQVFLEQLYTFGAVHRDPRTRVVTVAYYALVDPQRLERAAPATTLARVEVPWEGETGGPVEVRAAERELTLAFDHADILGTAVKRIRGKLDYTPIGFQLLPERFTLSELQRVHETVLGRPLNKDSFRRRMLASGQLEATGELQREVDHRPAELYRFSRRSAV